MAKHTPGPWLIAPGPQIVRVGSGNGISVALVSRLRDEYEANARLIAAAPELLDMVETLADGLAWNIDNIIGMNESDSEALAAARALIAKVRGE